MSSNLSSFANLFFDIFGGAGIAAGAIMKPLVTVAEGISQLMGMFVK